MSEPTKEQVEAVARSIFDAEEEYSVDHLEAPVGEGRDKRKWRIPGLQWDHFPDLELCEHQRDSYRDIARILLADPRLKIEVTGEWKKVDNSDLNALLERAAKPKT